MAGVYELEHMTPALSRRLYREGVEAVEAGGWIQFYPVCGLCDRRGWRLAREGSGPLKCDAQHDLKCMIV